MKSYNLTDYLDGPPVTYEEVRRQDWIVSIEKLTEKLNELSKLRFYESEH